MRVRDTALTALTPLVWGTTYLVTTELLPPGHPLFAALARALPAGLLALLLARRLPAGSWWWKAAVLGVLNIGVFLPLLFLAAYRLPGGVAATLGAGQPMVVALLAIVLLSERLSTWRMVWGLVGLIGVALVVLRADAVFDAVGVAAGLAGAAAMGWGVTLTKRWGLPAGVGPLALTGWQLTAGGLFLLPLTLAVEGVPQVVDRAAVAGYLWLGVFGGLLSYFVWFRGIGRLPVTSVAVLTLLSPLTAAGLGALVLDQYLGTTQVIGFALALAAILAAQISPRRERDPVGTATDPPPAPGSGPPGPRRCMPSRPVTVETPSPAGRVA